MCCCGGETTDHLLLHCSVAADLWSWVFHSFGVQWVISGTVDSLLSSWWNRLRRHSSAIWNMVPICLMWTTWKERNNRTFEDVSHSDRQILENFTSTLFEWSRTWGCTTTSSFMEFSSSLYLISHDVNLWCVSVHTLCTLHSFFNKFSTITYIKKKKMIYNPFVGPSLPGSLSLIFFSWAYPWVSHCKFTHNKFFF